MALRLRGLPPPPHIGRPPLPAALLALLPTTEGKHPGCELIIDPDCIDEFDYFSLMIPPGGFGVTVGYTGLPNRPTWEFAPPVLPPGGHLPASSFAGLLADEINLARQTIVAGGDDFPWYARQIGDSLFIYFDGPGWQSYVATNELDFVSSRVLAWTLGGYPRNFSAVPGGILLPGILGEMPIAAHFPEDYQRSITIDGWDPPPYWYDDGETPGWVNYDENAQPEPVPEWRQEPEA